ncbi:hypothetical protein NBRC116588_27800 [Pyruvatibacter sp. HU-CL02332]|uniref:hypothetical protein n=1 Tax=Pyruvatibacter sp. HU-CL02332 TaxID=3127650 RepID=UPI0031021091
MQKLPLRATWLAALKMPWQHRGTFFKIMWPWMLAAGVVYLAAIAISFAAMAGATQPTWAFVISMIAGVAAMVLASPAIVGALRYVITNEAQRHGFGDRTKKFLLAYLIMLAVYLPVMGLYMFSGPQVAPDGTFGFARPNLAVTVIVITLIILPIVMRLGFVFPAIVDDEPIDFARAWGRTEGNTWRVLFGYLILSMGVTFVGSFVIGFLGAFLTVFSGPLAPAVAIFSMLLNILLMIYLLVCILSWFGLSYLALASNRPEPQTPASSVDSGWTGNGG